MKIQFNAPIQFDKVTYGKGTHDVPAVPKGEKWFFDALVKEGKILVLREDKPAKEAKKAKGSKSEVKNLDLLKEVEVAEQDEAA